MKYQTLTAAIIVIEVFAGSAYDVFVGWYWGEQATVSWVLRQWAYDYPVVALLAGVVCGHLFWSRPNPVIIPPAKPELQRAAAAPARQPERTDLPSLLRGPPGGDPQSGYVP